MEAIDDLVARIVADHASVDMIVNNAGRSIRRSISLSLDRFHDFERTMQLNYFGAIRLVMGLLPHMRERSVRPRRERQLDRRADEPAAVQRLRRVEGGARRVDATSSPRELVGDGVSFTTIHMPLVRTPMIAPTKIYDTFPTLSPDEAADLVCEALRRTPKSINTRLGDVRRGRAHARARRPSSRCSTWPTRCSRTPPPRRADGPRREGAHGADRDGEPDEGRALVGGRPVSA